MYLEAVLIKPGREIVAHPLKMIIQYSDELNSEYGEILDYLHQNVHNGDIIALEQYVKDKVNGSFTRIIRDFIHDYESYKDNND